MRRYEEREEVACRLLCGGRRLMQLLLLCSGMLIGSCSARIQTGAIEGHVSGASGISVGQGASSTDSSIPAIPNTNIMIRNLSTSSVRTVRADRNGNFRVEGLPPGRYEVSFAAKPFRQQSHEANVRPGETTNASTRMLVGRDAEDIVDISGCPARPVGSSVPPEFGTVEIRLRRTACYGPCPVYSVRLYGDGRVEYKGNRYVSVLGVKHYRVDPAAVAGLARKFYEKGFFNFCASYREPVTDEPTVETAIHAGNLARMVSVYGSKAPEGLEDLQARIEQTAKITEFVKPPTALR